MPFFLSANVFLQSLLRNQYLGGKRAVLAVAVDIAVKALDDRVHPDKPKAVSLALCGLESSVLLYLLFGRGQVGKRNIKLCALHVHINTYDTLVLGQSKARFYGVIKKISDYYAQIKLRGL